MYTRLPLRRESQPTTIMYKIISNDGGEKKVVLKLLKENGSYRCITPERLLDSTTSPYCNKYRIHSATKGVSLDEAKDIISEYFSSPWLLWEGEEYNTVSFGRTNNSKIFRVLTCINI